MGERIMHVYIATRGQKEKVDKFIQDLGSQYFKYKHSPHETEGWVQLGVRPIEIWEIAFPKQHLNEVLATLNGSCFKITAKRKLEKPLAILFTAVRKLLRLKDVPLPIPPNTPMRITQHNYVDVKFIGIKEDEQDGSIELV